MLPGLLPGLLATNPLTGKQIDLAVTAYADDLRRTVAAALAKMIPKKGRKIRGDKEEGAADKEVAEDYVEA